MTLNPIKIFKNMKIKTKLILGFLFVASLILVGGTIGFTSSKIIAYNSNKIINEDLPIETELNHLKLKINEQKNLLNSYLLGNDNILSEFEKTNIDLDNALYNFKNNELIKKQNLNLSNIEILYNEMNIISENAISKYKESILNQDKSGIAMELMDKKSTETAEIILSQSLKIEMLKLLDDQTMTINDYVITGDSIEVTSFYQISNEIKQQKEYLQIKDEHEIFEKFAKDTIRTYDNSKFLKSESKKLSEKYDIKFNELNNEINLIDLKIIESINISKESSQKLQTILLPFLIIGTLLGIIMAILIGLYITSLITKPLKKIEDATLLLSEGKLSTRINGIESKDEIGTLATTLNLMLENIVTPIQKITENVEAISNGDLTEKLEINVKGDLVTLTKSLNLMTKNLNELISEIKSQVDGTLKTSEDLSASSEEVNASTEQISSTMQELTKGSMELTKRSQNTKETLKNIVSSLNEIGSKIRKTADSSQESQKVVQEGIMSGSTARTSMNEILNSSKDASKSLYELKERSLEVGKIVDVINHVSEQTNLLALNAAIEAARAGDAGRGFAVVADEVRKLAEQTNKSTKQISELIESMQKGTIETTEKMEITNKHIEAGNEKIDQALSSLEIIGSMSNVISQNVQEVASEIEMINGGTAKIQKDIEQVSNVAEESSVGAESINASMQETVQTIGHVSNSAQSLTQQAIELKKKTDKFKLNQ